MPFVRITGIGAYVPERVVTNEALANDMNRRLSALDAEGRLGVPLGDTLCSADWILERTGIEERRIAAPDQCTSDLAVAAIRQCQKRSGYYPQDRSIVVIGTVAGDFPTTPPTAAIVQAKMGWPVRHLNGQLVDRLVYDTNSACSTFGVALAQVESAVRSGNRTGGISAGADIMSLLASPLARGIAPILGDGAFAMSLEATDRPEQDCFLPEGRSFFAGSDGSYSDLIIMRAGGTACPVTLGMLQNPLALEPYIDMKGNEVFKVIVRLIRDRVIPGALNKARLRLDDIGLFIFHQANLRMIEPITKRLQISDRTFNNIQRYGNTTSASVGLCMEEAWLKGILQPGMLVMLIVFGGGLTWVTTILKWPDLERGNE